MVLGLAIKLVLQALHLSDALINVVGAAKAAAGTSRTDWMLAIALCGCQYAPSGTVCINGWCMERTEEAVNRSQ